MTKLVLFMPGEDRAREFPLSGPVRIGRHPAQDLQLLDRLVSKSHARIERTPAGWTIVDLNSRNGTFVNHRLISAAVVLSSGDQVLLGSTVIRFVEESARDQSLTRVTFTSTDDLQVGIYAAVDASEPTASSFQAGDEITDPDSLRDDYERLRMVHSFSHELALEVDRDRLLEKLLDRILSWVRADRGVVLLPDENDETKLTPQYIKTSSDVDSEIRLSETIVQQVTRDRKAILSADAQVDSRFDQSSSIIMEGIRSTMTVPMLQGDRVVGVIHVDSLFEANAFTNKDLQILQSLAAQAALAIENVNLVRRARREEATRERFSRLFSPNLVEKVVSGELDIRKGGEICDVTVLFADIRGFTRMTEEFPAPDIVEMLNEYFEIMVEIVFEYQGTLDKFLGDGLMAFWGAPVPQEEHTRLAVAAGLRMQKAMKSFNSIRVARGQPPIHAGLGIDSGENVVGYMGSSKTLSYSVIGEGVNRAARLCAAALKGEVLVSAEAQARASAFFTWETRPPLSLRGFRLPARCFRATGNVPDVPTS